MKQDVKDTLGRAIRDLRISVTDRCNFRCPYCMPAEVYGARYKFLPKPQLLTFEEIARLTKLFVDLGVTKVRLTGGEPLIRNNLEELVSLLSSIQGIQDLTLTTNGYLLAGKAQALKDAGLSRITVSLDSLDDEVFKKMNGRNFGPKKVLEGITKSAEVGLTPIKINSVVQRGVNDHTIVDLATYFRGTGHIVRFIEFMDVGNINGWKLDQVVNASDIASRIDEKIPIEAIEPNYPGEVALRYRYKDGSGEIGIIASVTKPFCGACTRARISTDGNVFTCLFGSVGHNLRQPLRSGASDEELKATIKQIWGRRTDQYSEERASMKEPGPKKVEMYQIGG